MLPPLRLSVLGNSFHISLDHRETRDALATLFRRFQVGEAPGGEEPPRRVEVRTGAQAALVIDGEPRKLPSRWSAFQSFVALNEIFLREARGCRVLHAAALTHAGRAILVAGPSTYGKSTLSFLLAERGLGFLGDDFAPLDLETGEIQPFPKAVGLRPGVQDLLSSGTRARLSGLPERTLGEKHLVDVEELFPGSLAGPAPVGLVVLLVPPEGAPDRSRQHLEVGALGEPPGLAETLAAFGRLEGPVERDGVHCFTLHRGAGEGPGVRELAAALDPFAESLLYVEKTPPSPPRFDRAPVIEDCPSSEGLLSLASDLLDRNGPRGRVLDEEENAVGVLFQLAEWLGRARFLRLRIGRFPEMADRIVREARGEPGTVSR